jgi:hypothetical protein
VPWVGVVCRDTGGSQCGIRDNGGVVLDCDPMQSLLAVGEAPADRRRGPSRDSQD